MAADEDEGWPEDPEEAEDQPMITATLGEPEMRTQEEIEFDELDPAEQKLALADRLDEEAKHNEELAAVALTDTARKRLLWEANQKRGEAVRRWQEGQLLLFPHVHIPFTKGAGKHLVDDDDDDNYEIPQRIRDMYHLDGFV